MDRIAQLRALLPAMLPEVVRQALREPGAEIESWSCDPIHMPVRSGFTAGLYRVSGLAHLIGQQALWSVVLKVIHRPDGTTAYDDPRGTPYWRREACAYESGLLDNLPGGLAAPRCFAVMARPDQTVFVWLEEIADHFGDRWPLDWYGVAARHIGQFNGAYLTDQPVPAEPWLAVEPLRGWLVHQADSVKLIERPEIWQHPLLRRLFPLPITVRLLRLWSEREAFLAVLSRLPQTLCHFDATHHNLLPMPASAGRERTVAIDWESVGIAAVGEDAGILGSAPFIRGTLDPADLPSLQERVFAGYLEGLHDAGWYGDRRVVRLGYAANAALRWVFGAPSLRAIIDKERWVREEQRWGRSMEELLEARAALTYALLDLADEARALMDRV
ncbi:MAG: hypothetical protein ACR2PL_22655 [Dehalococcoidia bacterium]